MGCSAIAESRFMSPKKTLRLSTVITAMTFGGAQRILIDYLSLMPDWIEKEVIGVYPGDMAKMLRDRGIKITEYDYRGKDTWKAIAPLRRHFLETRPHLVHTHLGKADFVGRTAARLAGVPAVVTTVHNKDDWKEMPLLNFIDNLNMKLADEIIAVANATRDYLLEKGHNGKNLRVCYARVELRDRFATLEVPEDRRRKLWEELSLPPDVILSIMVGRMYPQKAQETSLRALAQLPKTDRPHVLLLAGDGPQRAQQEALAREILPPESYRFLGNRHDVEDLLKVSQVYVMPSRWEGAPLALQEAFAAGLPAVISDIPSMSEVQESCRGGLVFPVDDPAAMAQAWFRLLQDEGLRRELGTRARQAALANWDIRMLCQDYLRTYADVCSRPGKFKAGELPEELLGLGAR